MKNWFKKQIVTLALAMSNVEKNALGQAGDSLDSMVNHVQNKKHGDVMDSLIKGEINQEVIDTRWRMYKVLGALDKKKLVSIDDGFGGSKNVLVDIEIDLDSISTAHIDNYNLIMFVDNKNLNEELSTTLNNFLTDSGDPNFIKPIIVEREITPSFRIEKYTKYLHVKKSVDTNEYIIEFYISKYPDEYDKKTNFLVSEIKRAMGGRLYNSLSDIRQVGFISNKTVGTLDNLEYTYTIDKFLGIIEHDGNYVFRFKVTPTVNGVSILEKYRSDALDERYNNKDKR
jgi:hypothetical protein